MKYLAEERLINALSSLHLELAVFKVIISDKHGKTISLEMKDKEAQPLIGSRIGDLTDSSVLGIDGGKFRITGGSDKSGTPMRWDVHGGVKKYVLLSKGTGMRSKAEGIRRRKLIRGNVVTDEIYQLNCLLVEGNLPDSSVEDKKGSQQK
ncbi:MAG TPA: S6e family ribosomal protein [Nitrososphaeraceae archaeon]